MYVDGARCWPYCEFSEVSPVVWVLIAFQVEFGSPNELLGHEKGFLRALVDESGDREKLYAMAAAAESGQPSS